MIDLAIPAFYALLVWWFGTGIVLFAVRQSRAGSRIGLAISAVLALAAFAVIAVTADTDGGTGAYTGFTAAIVVWGFVEFAFLTGAVVGANRDMCPATLTGWPRAGRAAAAIIHHELLLAAGGLVILALTFGAENTTALWTYCVLWLMRLSAKLNLFLGVPNLHDEHLPQRLSHLRSYFRRRAASLRLMLSIAAPLIAAAWLLVTVTPDASALATTRAALLATLLILAALEHAFMLLPIPVMKLWDWRVPARSFTAPTPPVAAQSISLRPHPETHGSITRRGS